MRSSKLPAAATWLLEHLQSGSRNDHITGDMMEAYQSGRSRAWYWKEVLSAIFVSFCQEIVAHPVLAVRATAIGWAIYLSYQYGVGPRVLTPLVQRFLPWLWTLPFSPWVLIWGPLAFSIHALSGWIVGQLHRSHRTAMVLIFATSISLFEIPQVLPWIWVHVSWGQYSFLPTDLSILVLPLAILFGGLWGASQPSPSPTHKVTIIP
jgi:hypothetical protein